MRWPALVVLSIALFGCSSESKDDAPTNDTDKPKPSDVASISGVRWGDRKPDLTGKLYVQTTDGNETLVAEDATDSTIGADRQTLYYTFFDGSTSGEGLKVYAIKSGKSELVFNYDKEVLTVIEATSNTGRTVVIVNAMDLENETPEVIVADPARGRVFWLDMAHFASLNEGIATFSVFTASQIKGVPYGAWPKPEKTETHELDVLLRGEATKEPPQ